MADEILQSVSSVVVGVCTGLIAVALTRLPRNRVGPVVYAFVASGFLWAVGDAMATLAADMRTKQIGLAVLYTGTITIAPFLWILALRWADAVGAELPLRSRWWTVGPLAFAAAMWLVMITNPWHGAFITPVIGGRNVYQPFWYAMTIPSYVLVTGGVGVELVAAWRVHRREVRRQAAFLVAANAVSLLGNMVYTANAVGFNPTALLLAVSGALLVVGMAREGLFGVLPAALPTIADDHPDGLLVVGPEGRVRYANARAGELLAPLDVHADVRLRATLRAARLEPESLPELDEASDSGWWAALTSEVGVLFFKDDLDDPRWLHAHARAVRGSRDNLKGYSLRLSDVTALRQAELQQRQSRRLESVASLARTVSRDFQSTFSVILANAEMLENLRGGRAVERRVARIFEAADHGLDVAHQLQLYAGSVDASRVVLDLAAITDEIRGVVEEDVPADVRMTLHRGGEALPVDADALQLRHAVFNLLTNAVEATREAGGEVRIETGAVRLDPEQMEGLVHGQHELPGDFAFVRVSDQGGGMDRETEERAFEPFFSTRHKDRGNGLPLVLGIARAHDALLQLENQPGRGCTFSLYLPLSEEVDDGE